MMNILTASTNGFVDNIPSLIVLLIVVALFVGVLVKEIRKHKNGGSSCSCGGNCGACGLCTPPAKEDAVEESAKEEKDEKKRNKLSD